MSSRIQWSLLTRRLQISSLLPSNKNRSILVHTLVKQYGLLDGTKPQSARPVYPIPATVEELTRYHSRQYVDFVLDPRNFSVENDGMPSRAHEEFGIQEVALLPWKLREQSLIVIITGLSFFPRSSQVYSSSCWCNADGYVVHMQFNSHI